MQNLMSHLLLNQSLPLPGSLGDLSAHQRLRKTALDYLLEKRSSQTTPMYFHSIPSSYFHFLPSLLFQQPMNVTQYLGTLKKKYSFLDLTLDLLSQDFLGKSWELKFLNIFLSCSEELNLDSNAFIPSAQSVEEINDKVPRVHQSPDQRSPSLTCFARLQAKLYYFSSY